MLPTTLKIDQLPKLPPQPVNQPQQSQEATNPSQQSQAQEATATPPPSQPGSSDFIDAGTFFSEFKTEKETTAKVAREPGAGEEVLEENEQKIFAPVQPAAAERPKMDESEARKQTEILMSMRQTLQSYGIAWYADGSFRTEAANKYNYAPADFNKLVEAWTPVVQTANIRVPPFAHILLVEAVCTGPLIGLMQQNRKVRKQNEAYARENAELREQLKKQVSKRPPTKTAWKLGSNGAGEYGYFQFTPAGTYLKNEERTEKPVLNDENIQLLIAANGEAAIAKLMGK